MSATEKPVLEKKNIDEIKVLKSSAPKKKTGKYGFDNYFCEMLDDAGIGIVLVDSDRKVLRANKYFQNLLGFTESELKAISLKDINHPDDFIVDARLFSQISSGEKSGYSIEKRYISKKGKLLHARLTVSGTDHFYKNKRLFLAVIEDISKQKCFEMKLIKESNYLKVLLENIPDSIYFKDLESRFLKISSEMAKKHKTTVENIIGKTDFDLYGKTHAREALEDEQTIIQTGIPIIDKEEKEDYNDGHITWTSSTKMPFRNENGEVIGTFGISRNITRKKKNEITHNALLNISETVFTASDMHSMFAAIHEILGTLMPVKNLFIALYDEKSDMLTFPYYIDEYDEPRETSKPKKGLTEYILRTGKAQLIDEARDYELRRQGETEIIGTPAKIWLGVPLKVNEKTIGVIVVQDYENAKAYQESELQLISFIAEQIALVIERKRTVVEIANYTEKLKELNATKDKFFSIIAHDLKNPFITIMGFSELLLSDYNELSDDEKIFYLEEMKKSSETSHTLLQNLLQWSRSQTGFIEFHPQAITLSFIVNENIILLKSTADKKSILINSSIDDDIKVLADSDMINAIIRNLISNAIKFTPRNGKISLSAERINDFIYVSVHDTGIGMTRDIMEKLFRIDIQHTTQGTENECGSGLGLMLSREFVKKNGGDIWVESEINKGSKFTFSVPVV